MSTRLAADIAVRTLIHVDAPQPARPRRDKTASDQAVVAFLRAIKYDQSVTGTVLDAWRPAVSLALGDDSARWKAAIRLSATRKQPILDDQRITALAEKIRRGRRRGPSRGTVEAFLRAAGRTVPLTDDVLELWRPAVTLALGGGKARWDAAVRLTNQHGRPVLDPDLIEAEALAIDEQRRRRRARHNTTAREATAFARANVAAAVAYVETVWADTGSGPTRSELAAALNTPPPYRHHLVPALQSLGVLTSTPEHRSLRVARSDPE